MVGVDAVAGDGFVVVDAKMERYWAGQRRRWRWAA
jgi:hypothetical protein